MQYNAIVNSNDIVSPSWINTFKTEQIDTIFGRMLQSPDTNPNAINDMAVSAGLIAALDYHYIDIPVEKQVYAHASVRHHTQEFTTIEDAKSNFGFYVPEYDYLSMANLFGAGVSPHPPQITDQYTCLLYTSDAADE